MALTQVKTLGIADDAVTEAKVANDAISPTEMKAGTDGHIITYDASGNPTTVGPGTDGELITYDASGNPAKVAVGTNGHVLTSNGSGAAPTFQAASGGIASLVADTSPQLGGDLDVNGNQIKGDDVQIHAADDSVIAKFHKTNSSEFHFNGSKKLEVTNTGIGVTGSITPSGGLYLGGSGGSNYLDDYEEGSWTPYLSAGTTGDLSNSGHYSNQDARYTKIGRLVIVNFYIVVYHSDFANMTGDLMIKGLPFAPASGHPNCYVDIAMYSGVNVNDYYNYWATAGYHTDRFYIYGKTASSQQQAMGTWMDADCTLAGVIPYMMS